MADLEKAILLLSDPSSPPALKSQALAFLDQSKLHTPSSSLLPPLLHLLSSSPHPSVRFFSLQTLIDLLPVLPPSSDLPFLQSSLLSLASSPPFLSSCPPFLKNKLAQALSFMISLHYPHSFPNPFLHLLPSSRTSNEAAGMFSRLLAALDDDLLSLKYPRSPAGLATASRVKDSMREQCIPQIVQAWFEIVSFYRSSDPGLVAGTLDAMRRYISWIDIGLVANDAFVPLLFDMILSSGEPEGVRATASGCVLAIVSKRMEHRAKLGLLRNLRVNRVFPLVSAGNNDSEFVLKLAALITRYAAEALECCKRLGSEDVEGASMELLEEALPLVFYVLKNCEGVDSGSVVEFLSDYVSYVKSPARVGQILEVTRGMICYDPMYRINLGKPDRIGREEEEHMVEHRKGLFALFRSVCQVAPDVTQLFIRKLLANALSSSSEMSVEEVEASLSLFYQLGETISEEEMRTGSGLLKELVPMLLSARFQCHSHRIVALAYLATITKYMKFVQENTQYIPHVLTAFLDERGVHHLNLDVSQRAGYQFMKAVKLLKTKLVPYIDSIMQSLQDTIVRITGLHSTAEGQETASSEDGSHIFEAIGLLIGMENVSPEKQYEYLAALLTPLRQQVELLLSDAKVQKLEETSAKAVKIEQTIVAINALSKGFSERLVSASRPKFGIILKETLDVLLQILVVFPNIEPLRNRVTSFLHRMVDILGGSIFPYLPMALEQLLTKSEPKEMVDFLLLINQLICKFGTSMACILDEIFPVTVSRIFHILPRDAFSSGPGCNTEEIRELQELQRTFFTFLYVITTHDLSSVFLSQKSRGYFDAIMQLLLFASCSHNDVFIRKQCVQIFVRLIKDWCTKYDVEDKVPGFRSFIIETFAPTCCLYSVLDKSFDFRDANTLVLFGEIVVAQKVMYEKFGNDFIIHFVSNGLPAAHCPQDLAKQYYRNLQGSDINFLKSFYQNLIENLRQQQNESFVFR